LDRQHGTLDITPRDPGSSQWVKYVSDYPGESNIHVILTERFHRIPYLQALRLIYRYIAHKNIVRFTLAEAMYLCQGKTMRSLAKRKPLLVFFLLAFGISWGIPGLAMLFSALTGAFEISLDNSSPLTYIAVWAPAIAAFLTIGLRDGWSGIKAYARRCLRFTGHWGWYLGVLVGIPLMIFAGAILTEAAGIPALIIPTGAWLGVFLVENLQRGTLGPFEELGWRGYALPLLQRRYSGWVSALILGTIWGLWHFPAFFMDSLMTGVLTGNLVSVLLRFVANTIITSIIMTIVYNGSLGSIPLMFLYHWLTNVHYPWELEAGITALQDMAGLLVALALVLIFGRRYLRHQNLYMDEYGNKNSWKMK
jgi:membrane protease YdiL (CAAX protease family)